MDNLTIFFIFGFQKRILVQISRELVRDGFQTPIKLLTKVYGDRINLGPIYPNLHQQNIFENFQENRDF